METTAWNAFWRTVTRFDRSKINPPIAIRNAMGVVLPLAIAGALGRRSYGLVGALGALNVAYSDGDDAYGMRARRMLSASVVVAAALLTGGLTGHYNFFAVAVAMIWAFAAGLLVAVGTTAGDIGTVSLVTLVIFASRPLTLQQATISGLVALGGALLQTSLSLLFWPVRRFAQERRLLSGVYRELGHIATQTVKPGTAPLATAEFTKAQDVLFRQDRGPQWERMYSLLSQAERIRLRLVTLGRLRRRLVREERGPLAAAALDGFSNACCQLLNSIAEILNDEKAHESSLPLLHAAEQYFGELRTRDWENASSFFLALIRDATAQMDALMGQIRAALRLAERKDFDPPVIARTRRLPRNSWALGVRNQAATLRANLTMRSAAFRHALRLAVCVGVGDALGRSFDWQRSYWIPMTIAIILKPDFLSTFSRGVLRLAGTFFGLIVATVLYHLLPPGTLTDVVFVGAFTLMLRWVGPANYGVFVVAVSGLVVALIANSGTPPRQVIPLRALNTLIGGSLALLAYAVWPTWERSHSGESLARLLDAYRAYVRALLETVGTNFTAVDQARQAARVARSNAEASAERLRMEPGTTTQLMQSVAAMLVSSHDFIYAVMAIEGAGDDGRSLTDGAVQRFFHQVELTLYFLSASLRGNAIDMRELPDLREQHRLMLGPGGSKAEAYSLVRVETDRMTNALNTLKEQIFNWLARRGKAPTD